MLLPDFEEAFTLRGAVVASISDDAYFELCQANELLHIERTPKRGLIIRPLPGFATSELVGIALFQVAAWSRHYGGHTLSWAGYTLPDGAVLGPGVSWVSEAAYSSLTRAQRLQFPPLCPQFVLELKAPFDCLITLQNRFEQWLSYGVELAILLDAAAEAAYLYRPGQLVELVQGFDNELSGELVLPGFRLDLRELREAAS
jgi:Uma2 family endonuclease